MARVLVTGFAGFIGSHLCEHLLKEGHSVIGIDNFNNYYDPSIKVENIQNILKNDNFTFIKLDLIDEIALIDFFNGKEIDIVVHLAASAGVRPSMAHPVSYASNNITALVSLLNAMEVNGLKKLIFASSSSVYGGISAVPFREEMILDKVMSTYAATKLSGEVFNQLYHDSYDFSIINLRFFTVYGPRQRPDLAINKFFQMLKNDETITLFGEGKLQRDYTYIDDITNGVYSAIKRISAQESKLFETYNLGNNSPISTIDLLNKMESISGKKANYIFQDTPLGDVPITFANIDKAKENLNFQPSTTIDNGLFKFWEWLNTAKK